ncbi:MAG: S53 family peptidase [Bryobacteraceae bacterium]
MQLLALVGLILAFTARDNAQTAGPRAVITQAIDENRLVTLMGNTRPEANSQNDLGPVANDLHLDMYLQLKRSPEQDLAAEQFVESLTDKASRNFHKWITAAEYGRRFGAASEDIATVSHWLESHGFTVNGVPANNMVIDFSGNAGQVREALHTEIHALDIAGERHFANMSDPQIPAALLPAVTGVVSLNNFKPQPMLVPKGQYTVNSYYSLLVPGDLATIYNLNPAFSGGYTGQGQTIVVVEDTDLYNGAGDWAVFRETFGLALYPYGSLTEVHPAPGTGAACNDPGINSDDSEAAIDVEWASAAAPNAAIVMASCADTTNFGGFIALQNLLTNGGPVPGVVSISYGQSETVNGAAFNSYINALYQTAAAAGVSVFVSSGDSAASGTDRGGSVAIHGINVSGWASTIYNVAVGGTDFGDTAAHTTSTFWNSTNGPYYNSAKSYVPEIPWNESCASVVLASYYGFSTTYGPTGICNIFNDWLDTVGGSGGPSGCATGAPTVTNAVSGTCAGWAKPSWQSIFGNPSDGVRDMPDVALFASAGFWGHYYVVCYSDEGYSCAGAPDTWAGYGGTSVSSPIMAGVQALINQALGSKNVGNPNPVYYEIGQNEYSTSAGRAACNSTTGPASTCSFNDITEGDMDVPCAGAFNCYLDGEALGVLSTSNTSYAPAYGTAPGWDFATGIGSVNAFNLLQSFMLTENAPRAVSVTPNSGVGSSQSFTFQFSSASGYGYLKTMYMLFNATLSSVNGCKLEYSQSTNHLYLYTNSGGALTGPVTPGVAGTLSNSQCSVNAGSSSVSGSVDTLSLDLAVTFIVPFVGVKNVYGYAADDGGLNSGWQTLGTWNTAAGGPPAAVSVTPNSGTGMSGSFTFKFSSVNGYGYLKTMYMLFNATLSSVNGCKLEYSQSTNHLYLYTDSGGALTGPVTPGVAGTLSNGQCTVNAGSSSVSGSVDTLSLDLAVSFTVPFAGLKNVYGYAADDGGLNSGWQALGTWNTAAP